MRKVEEQNEISLNNNLNIGHNVENRLSPKGGENSSSLFFTIDGKSTLYKGGREDSVEGDELK